ncbi:MAG: glycoside hydrolase family 65 protein, partial [Gammaproteobacteria bacterium]
MNRTPASAVEPWGIRETQFSTEGHFLAETLFALGNGYIGLRGTGEEGYSGPVGTSLDGSYLNGFYESEPITYPEAAFGLAKTNQFMLNVPNAKGIELLVDGERFDPLGGGLASYERHLDFRTGVLERRMEWQSTGGKRLAIRSRRLVSLTNKHLFAIDVEVTPLNFSGRIELRSTINRHVKNLEAGDDPRVGSVVSGPALTLVNTLHGAGFTACEHKTHNSGFHLLTAIETVVVSSSQFSTSPYESGALVGRRVDATVEQGVPLRLTKYGCYHASRDYPVDELPALARACLMDAQAKGFATLCGEQAAFLADYWNSVDVEIAGDESLQQGIRFNQFHLLQSVGRDGKTNIAAKGITGEGYEGHYFWDTEIYIFPYFLYNKPEIARRLLDYRYAGLPAARKRAREMAHATGALFPWRTIAGDECSAYFPAGTAQYHINADIAYSISKYFEATGDLDYMAQAGFEIVAETARIWLGIGTFDRDGRFCINEVTGPDEYTALVNNNFYTNAMAQAHLRFVLRIAAALREERPLDYGRVVQAIALSDAELDSFARAADAMHLPYDDRLGVHEQDDTFLSKKVWDFANTPKENYPLLLNYHPLVIYRHQVCKQADVVLALLLLSDRFTLDEKRRDFDYYEAVTTHDSSLSTCIFSIIAAEIGHQDKA